MLQAVIVAFLVAYFLGNHNGAIVVSAWIAHDDVRTHGSGNAGLTNFVRSYGTKSALLVIAVDVLKTMLGVVVGGALLNYYGYAREGMMLGGAAASLGHDYPMMLGFKGGKGVLCGATVAFMLDWKLALILAVVFVACVALTRYVSMASILISVGFALGFSWSNWGNPWLVSGSIFMAAMVIWMHRENIRRLLQGKENRFSLPSEEKKQ